MGLLHVKICGQTTAMVAFGVILVFYKGMPEAIQVTYLGLYLRITCNAVRYFRMVFVGIKAMSVV